MLLNLLERLKEPSTWVSIALILGVFGFTAHLSEWITANTTVLVELASALLAFIAALMPERGAKK